MNLAPREIDKLHVYVVADLARRRRDRGTKLNYSEAAALITEAVLEAARDGHTVAECMELGRKVVTADDVMPGVREMLTVLQVETAFVDGTKLVTCHDPISPSVEDSDDSDDSDGDSDSDSDA
jgi:urease subunit gamma